MSPTQTQTLGAPAPSWIDEQLDEEWPASPKSPRPTPSPTVQDADQGTTKGGTFLIREDIPPQAITPAAKPRSRHQPLMKDFFSPLALERMFEPPSPPRASSSNEPPITANAAQPFKPSALAKAFAAESQEDEDHDDAGRSVSEVESNGEQEMELEDEEREEDYGSQAEEDGAREEGEGPYEDEILATDIPGLAEFDGRKPSTGFQFTFNMPSQRRSLAPSPPPALDQPPIHSQESERRLRLFQVYDSYTKNQLSALVDSIAIKSSPATSGNGEDDPSPIVYHNRKRIKLSPVGDDDDEHLRALQKKSAPKRDFLRESQNLMQMIKQSRSLSIAATDIDHSSETRVPSAQNLPLLSDSASTHPPTPPHPTPVLPSFPPTPAAAPPERTALAYRLQAVDLMAQIRSDMHSKRRVFSWETDNKENWEPDAEAEEDDIPKPRPRKTDPSPRKLLRRLSAADEVDKELEADQSQRTSAWASFQMPSTPPDEDAQDDTIQGLNESERGLREISARLEQVHFRESLQAPSASPSSSSSSLSTPPNPIAIVLSSPTRTHQIDQEAAPVPNTTLLAQPRLPTTLTISPHGHEDLRRFVSSSTATSSLSRVGSQVSTGTADSHVKHAGTSVDPGPVGGGVRRIAPEDVGPAFTRVNGMVYDEVAMKWVKESRVNRSGAGDANVTEATESDVFGDIESLKSDDEEQGPPAEDGNEKDSDTGTEIEEEQDVSQGEVDLTSPKNEPTIPNHTTPIEGPRPRSSGTPRTRPGLSFQFPQQTEFETPLTRPRPHVQNPVQPPRSVLKQTPSGSRPCPFTPLNNSSSGKGKHRRSVSFSDGRKEGRIVELHHEDDVAGDAEGTSGVPSTRTKRILNALDDLVEDHDHWDGDGFQPNDFGPFDETPSKPAPRGNISRRLSDAGSADLNGRAPLIRSRSQRSFALPPRSTTPKNANGTFLTEASFRVTHDALVRVLTSIEPFEPYWETLTEIDMCGKEVDSVHRLKELLPILEKIQLDDNQLAWLSGIPMAVRTLSVSSNALTSITAYGHLPNLEYLDVSRNSEIDSLRQLECLRHLRELKAEGCQILSLDGLTNMESLIKLDLRSNKIAQVDFNKCRWHRMEVLDLSRNSIRSVVGLSALVSLTSLNMEHNGITALKTTSTNAKLRILRVSYNRLAQLDVSHFPNVRTLYADNNKLADFKQTVRLSKLENLSLRNQRGVSLKLATRDIRDVKRLYLSGNPLDGHFLQEPCYNLIYLELASCRLSSLPPDLSTLIPNLRVLNLNYNFLTDIRPLEGLVRLRKLTAVGSRLKGTKPVLRTLQRMPDMEMLDFRMNPCTLGWYLPLIIKSTSGSLQISHPEGEDGVTWQEQDSRFRRDLPDETYVGRLAYRGLAMRACPRIRMLDGVEVGSAEREKAEKLLNGIKGTRALSGSGSSGSGNV